MTTYNKLFENINYKNVSEDTDRLCEKWSGSGLLKGLNEEKKKAMSVLLENQAAQLLREASAHSTGAGALVNSGKGAGFSNIAFPVVRRVFSGLVASELVSVQPMSLPSGLVFYLDYTYGTNVGGEGTDAASVYKAGDSIYGNPAGAAVAKGATATGGQYDLMGAGYTRVHANGTVAGLAANLGSFDAAGAWQAAQVVTDAALHNANAQMVGYDPDLQTDVEANKLDYMLLFLPIADMQTAIATGDADAVTEMALTGLPAGLGGVVAWGAAYQGGRGVLNLRRLNVRGDWDGATFTEKTDGDHVMMVLRLTNGGAAPTVTGANPISMAVSDRLDLDGNGGEIIVPSFESDFAVDPSPRIPEIDIKLETLPVTTKTRKLRARWSPEMAQDINAYISLDAEVELTKILSEQITLEVDREILSDLLREAAGANLFWSRAPGKFVNKRTGRTVELTSALATGPQFTGSVREWYQTLVETIIDAANEIQTKTLRGSANFVVTSPAVCTILEQSSLYRTKHTIDTNGQVSNPMTIGAEAVGTVNNRFTVYKDPNFPKNKILLGFKGGSYLETGYVYAPYVPLISTPTIMGTEDFTPRKGLMTRYGKRMVRADFYGTVTVLDMNII